MSNIVTNDSIIQSPFNKQRKDKFFIVFNLPKVLKEIATKQNRNNFKILSDSIQFSVYGTVIPSIDVPAVKVPYSGQNLHVTSYSRPPFQQNTVNFTIDNMFNNYWVIYKWLNIFNEAREGVYNSELINDKGFLDTYSADISIFGLDEYNERVIEFKYFSSFPTKLGGILYNDRESGEMESSFEFAYFQFEAKLL